MTSSSGTLEHSNELRSASGTRTPRRVQWASHDDPWVNGYPQTSPRQTMHELDEMGTDPSAFETLRNALQRHQSGEHLLSESGLQAGSASAVPSVPPQAVVTIRVISSAPASHYSPLTTPPATISGYPPTRTNSDNPYPTTRAPQTQVSGSQGSGSSSTQSSPTIDDISAHHSASTLVAQRTHDVPGEVWIDPLEREGLPFHAPIPNSRDRREFGDALRRRSTMRSGSRDSDASFGERHLERMAERQAAGVVRAHTRRGWGRLHPSPNSKKDTKFKGTHKGAKDRGTDEKGKATVHTLRHTHSDTENDTDFTDGEFKPPGRMRKGVPSSWLAPVMRPPRTPLHGRQQGPEDHHRGHPHSPKFGNGVLSALLALYGHDHEQDDEGSASGASTPGGRSRTSSDAGSVDDILPKPHRPWLPDQPEDGGHDHPTPKGQKAAKNKFLGKFSLGRSTKRGSASSIIDHLRPPSLPATSTTAALIAGASTLSGAATPQQATLAPNLKRAGYNLVRCSVEGVPETPGEEMDSEAELPDTPGATIVASPTTGSQGLVHRPREGTPGGRKGWTGRLKDLPLPMHISSSHLSPFPSPHPEGGLHTPGESATTTPKTVSAGGTPVDEYGEKKDYFDLKHVERQTQRIEERERKERKERQRKRGKEMRRKRKEAEIYITRHVAEILQRQEFIMKLARAMMMFGGPSHRLAAQIQSTARVLELELSCMYLPDVMLISFEDRSTGTSNVKFIRQGSALDLEKLGDAHLLYWEVIHDTMSVSGASALLDVLMRKEPLYNFGQLTIIGGMCSASICSVSFSGSFIDSLVSAPLGALLVAIQLIGVRNELYVNVFEITIATLLSFLSAALASTTHFCYSAVASSSVVLILPGFIVLSGSLELSSRSLVAGAVRLCFALMYSLFLGFGLAIGAELYQTMLGQSVIGPTDYACMDSHDPTGPWWQRTPSLWWAFLTVPMYSLFLSMRLMAPLWRKEMILLIAIASIGWVTNHFVGTKFPNQSDISAAVGAFAVGFVSNIYGRFFNGNAFVVMITGILFQVPSGLGNGGLLNFVSDQTSGSSSTYLSGFQTALQLISVSIGLTVGLGISLVVVHPVLSRRRAGGLFSL